MKSKIKSGFIINYVHTESTETTEFIQNLCHLNNVVENRQNLLFSINESRLLVYLLLFRT